MCTNKECSHKENNKAYSYLSIYDMLGSELDISTHLIFIIPYDGHIYLTNTKFLQCIRHCV